MTPATAASGDWRWRRPGASGTVVDSVGERAEPELLGSGERFVDRPQCQFEAQARFG